VKAFTLIELITTLAIVAILVALAVPVYQGFIERGKLVAGTEQLVSLRGLMEQGYQAARSYRNGDDCIISDLNSDDFAFTCEADSNTTFLWTATSLGGVGLGNAGSYVYTVDQDGVEATTKYDGTTITGSTYWKIRD